jgi:cell division protease FtsH
MVGRWGMSEAIGPVSVLPGPGQESPFGISGVAPATEELVDAEVRKILEECYQHAVRTLTENRHHLDSLARTLIARETLDEPDAYAAAGIPRDPVRSAAGIPSNGVLPGDS